MYSRNKWNFNVLFDANSIPVDITAEILVQHMRNLADKEKNTCRPRECCAHKTHFLATFLASDPCPPDAEKASELRQPSRKNTRERKTEIR